MTTSRSCVNEMESAQRAYETTSQRYTQTNLEGQSNQSDIAVLAHATAPIYPAGPRVLLNTVLAIFFGTLLGTGFAMLAEMRDRRVRSAANIVELTPVTLLGEMDWSASVASKFALPSWLKPRRLFAN